MLFRSGLRLTGTYTTGLRLTGTYTPGLRLTGTYTPGLRLTGTYTTGLRLTGTYTTSLQLTGMLVAWQGLDVQQAAWQPEGQLVWHTVAWGCAGVRRRVVMSAGGRPGGLYTRAVGVWTTQTRLLSSLFLLLPGHLPGHSFCCRF